MYLVKNSKSPNYQIIYEVDGKRTTKSTGKQNRKEAERFLEEFQQTMLNEAENKSNLKASSIVEISLLDFKTEYEDYIRAIKSQKYLESITSSFDHLIRFTDDILLSQLNFKLLDQFFTISYQRTPHGAHHFLRTLKAAFSKAVLWEYLSENPFKKNKTS